MHTSERKEARGLVRTRTRKAYRFRIYPNEEQRKILERTLHLSERIHECPNCGLIIDRDWNAARNVLKKVGWGTVEFTLAEIKPLLQQPVVVEQAGSRNQEAHEL